MPNPAPEYDTRKSYLYQIHAGKTSLDMADADYRDLIARVTAETLGPANAVRSCGDITDMAALAAIVDALKAEGWHGLPPKRHAKRLPPLPQVRPEAKPYFRKVVALRLDMQKSWKYVYSIMQNMYGVERIEWLDATQMHGLMVALERKATAIKRGKAKEGVR
ncbi:regulatory protein GemA [Desulfovibrio sp. OttesenSCG-928-G15]|nr:regulatory protein GemA [Desulfovibrio sp. OttesenSCG-928-G15]